MGVALRLHPDPRWGQMAKMPARASAKGSGARVWINKNLNESERVRAQRGARTSGKAILRNSTSAQKGEPSPCTSFWLWSSPQPRSGRRMGLSSSITDERLREHITEPEQAQQSPDEQVPGRARLRARGSGRAPRGPWGPETRHASVSTLHLRRWLSLPRARAPGRRPQPPGPSTGGRGRREVARPRQEGGGRAGAGPRCGRRRPSWHGSRTWRSKAPATPRVRTWCSSAPGRRVRVGWCGSDWEVDEGFGLRRGRAVWARGSEAEARGQAWS